MLYSTEERLELTFRKSGSSLRARPLSFWTFILAGANVQILHRIQGAAADAYILSESSLLVFDRRLIIITCGATDLVQAATGLLDSLSDFELEKCLYQARGVSWIDRKKFSAGCEVLEARLSGSMATYHSQESILFTSLVHDQTRSKRINLQLLMHGIGDDACRVFLETSSEKRRKIIAELNLSGLFEGFSIDEHHFQPVGYSLNAIRDDEFYCVHVSPQESASFASVEFDGLVPADLNSVIAHLVKVFSADNFQIEILHDRGLPPPLAVVGANFITAPFGPREIGLDMSRYSTTVKNE